MMKSVRTTTIWMAMVMLMGLIGLAQVSCNKNVGEDRAEEDPAGHDHAGHDHAAHGGPASPEGTASSQPAPPEGHPVSPGGAASSQPVSPEGAASIHEEVVAELDLPESQAQQVREIFAAYREDVATWTAEHEAEASELRLVLKSFHGLRDDTTGENIQMAMARLGQLQAERNAKDEELIEQLGQVLTPEQTITAEGILHPALPEWAKTTVQRFHLLMQIGLTEEQLAQVKVIMDEASEAMASNQAGAASGVIMEEAWKRIIDNVLTPGNHEQMRYLIQKIKDQAMVVAIFGQLRLSRQQSQRIGDIWDRAYEEAVNDPGRKFEIYEAAHMDIVNNVLTSDQRRQLEPEDDSNDPHGSGG